MQWDPAYRGRTCGGLDVVGMLSCCSHRFVCYWTRAAESVDWTLAKGGRSINAGGVRLRADGGLGAAVEDVMARLVKLPQLELEVEHLRASLAKRKEGNDEQR